MLQAQIDLAEYASISLSSTTKYLEMSRKGGKAPVDEKSWKATIRLTVRCQWVKNSNAGMVPSVCSSRLSSFVEGIDDQAYQDQAAIRESARRARDFDEVRPGMKCAGS